MRQEIIKKEEKTEEKSEEILDYSVHGMPFHCPQNGISNSCIKSNKGLDKGMKKVGKGIPLKRYIR